MGVRTNKCVLWLIVKSGTIMLSVKYLSINLEQLFELLVIVYMTILLEETVFNATFTILRIIKEMNGNKFMCLQVTCNKGGRREQCSPILLRIL